MIAQHIAAGGPVRHTRGTVLAFPMPTGAAGAGASGSARASASSPIPHPSGAPYIRPSADRTCLRLLVNVDHHLSGLGHYTRLLSVSGCMSVADLVEAILTCYEWPQGDDGDAGWELRVRQSGVLRTYSRAKHSIGTEVGAALDRGGVGVLRTGGYEFFLSVSDVMVDPVSGVVGHWEGAAATTSPAEEDLLSHIVPGQTAPRPGGGGESGPDAVLLTAEFLADEPDDLSDATSEPSAAAQPPSGFPPHPLGIPEVVDVTHTNFTLAGEDSVENVLSSVDKELRALLRHGELFDFIPLLQALDLDRPAPVTERSAELLADAPVERTRLGRAAAWARIVALSALVDSAGTDRASVAFLSRLGFCRGDATDPAHLGPVEKGRSASDALTAEEIRTLSRATGKLLALAGADGWQTRPTSGPIPLVPQRSLVERLEMYRFLLQR
ncbi:hypothetical protein CHEID_10255 [Corynebacterium heidelbergense]|uniref:hypothetical protein n=1 Tax=Corynebacterium heidelbergense TaxID=2055947 RepID=UPI00235A0EEC|nr:hypothetical protein [Corynebacterium heidelbergense]WCZ37568.1 hypothetical protein CHEID_10255 [Corynebacterium heidelbergense]